MIAVLLATLVSATAAQGAPPPDPAMLGTTAPELALPRPDPDAELLRDLELLDQLELLENLELFDAEDR